MIATGLSKFFTVAPFTLCKEYVKNLNRNVTVVRPLIDGVEYYRDYYDDSYMYEVRSDDDWIGHVFDFELS